MGDEVLGALDDPGEIADAELAAGAQRKREHQSRRVAERAEALRERACLPLRRPHGPDCFRLRQVETEQIAAIISHDNTLTHVETFLVDAV